MLNRDELNLGTLVTLEASLEIASGKGRVINV